MTKQSFCAVATPHTIYAGPATKFDFDKIATEEHVHDWQHNSTTTFLKADGKQWETRCHSKTVEASGVLVIFQWFDERPEAAGDSHPNTAPATSA